MAPNIDKATSKEVGAPEIEKMREAFRAWLKVNDRYLHDGDTGDVAQLYLMLRETSPKYLNSSTSADNAS